MLDNGGAKKGQGTKLCAIFISFCISCGLAFIGYRFVYLYANSSTWRRTNAKILSLKITKAKEGIRKKCSVVYEYGVDELMYKGYRVDIHKIYGEESLCIDLRGKKTTSCFYDPKNPTSSALKITIPITLTTLMIMGSWAVLYTASCALTGVLKIVPILYGIASAGVLLKIAVNRLPIVDAGLIGGIILLILAVLGPGAEFCCYKFEHKDGQAATAQGYYEYAHD